ncbi:MAG: metalloregulator ArsR/SmtB family transcription factor [Cyanobacteria bacterium]|nr:metalloregulator ArsR/SmtB family transcription factor [Cyanobacteriota bacterium]
MPYRAVVSNELSKLFNVLSHPLRVRIVEELKTQELTVSALKDILELSPAATSQQLSILRSHGIVVENRQGRNVFYHLRKPEIAAWIMDGLRFIAPDQDEVQSMVTAIESARSAWGPAPKLKRKKAPSKPPKKGGD